MYDPTNSRFRFVDLDKDEQYKRFVDRDDSINRPIAPGQSGSSSHGSYGKKLFDPRWRMKRSEILARDNNSCVVCRAFEDLEVHHRQYHFVLRRNQFKDPWEYSDELMVTLCKICHQRGHAKYKVPTINI